MKLLRTLSLVSLLSFTLGYFPGGVAAEEELTRGEIQRIDKVNTKITLSHGPINNLGMPAMTMSFKLKDKAQLTKLKEGDQVRFRVEDVGGIYTIVRIEPAK